MWKVKMFFGEERVEVDKEFDTINEMNAYLEGVADGEGWLSYDFEDMDIPAV